MTFETLTALLTLTAMETVLGIDNIIFIAILVAKLPASQQTKARNLGISLALIVRIGLLFSLSWIMSLTQPFATIAGFDISGRNLILIGGGLFLVAKSIREIHDKVSGIEHKSEVKGNASKSFVNVIIQILLIDIVFSLDSVITAVGMVDNVNIMIAAMVISMLIMLAAAGPISKFVEKNPTIKIIAMSFLILIGVMLVLEGTGKHVEKSAIYFAMAFSLAVELLNMRYRKKLGAK